MKTKKEISCAVSKAISELFSIFRGTRKKQIWQIREHRWDEVRSGCFSWMNRADSSPSAFCRLISPAETRVRARYRMQIARACGVSAISCRLLVANSVRRMERGCGSCQGYDSLECKPMELFHIDLDPATPTALFLIWLSNAGVLAIRTQLIRCHYSWSCSFSLFSSNPFFLAPEIESRIGWRRGERRERVRNQTLHPE